MSSARSRLRTTSAPLSARAGASVNPQLPMTTVVTPCQHEHVPSGSQKICASMWVWPSMKPGVTTWPSASISCRPLFADAADGGDAAVSHADVGPVAGDARAVDDRAVADDQVVAHPKPYASCASARAVPGRCTTKALGGGEVLGRVGESFRAPSGPAGRLAGGAARRRLSDLHPGPHPRRGRVHPCMPGRSGRRGGPPVLPRGHRSDGAARHRHHPGGLRGPPRGATRGIRRLPPPLWPGAGDRSPIGHALRGPAGLGGGRGACTTRTSSPPISDRRWSSGDAGSALGSWPTRRWSGPAT